MSPAMSKAPRADPTPIPTAVPVERPPPEPVETLSTEFVLGGVVDDVEGSEGCLGHKLVRYLEELLRYREEEGV